MKVKLIRYDEYWHYNYIYEKHYNQKQFDYVFKYLNFDKLANKNLMIFFFNEETRKWFRKTYIDNYHLEYIYNNSPEGYEYLKNNYGKGVFKMIIYYSDKQEFKTIVNKVINVKLIRGVNYEN